VSISGDGNTIVSSEVFDDGSWDECSEVTSCAMKMEDLLFFRGLSVDTVYQGINYVLQTRLDRGCSPEYVGGISLDGAAYLSEGDLCVPYIRFCCSDVGVDQMVVFRALDQGGNQSDCMVNVEVQDKSVPSMTCPSDTVIDCRVIFDLNNLDLQFGKPLVVDNCSTTTEMLRTVSPDVNQCGLGEIERLFEIVDGNGIVARSCVQRILIINEAPFVESNIQWPLDFESSCGTVNLTSRRLVLEMMAVVY